MALADYRPTDKGEPSLDYLGDWSVICLACAKTHRTVVQPIDAASAEAALAHLDWLAGRLRSLPDTLVLDICVPELGPIEDRLEREALAAGVLPRDAARARQLGRWAAADQARRALASVLTGLAEADVLALLPDRPVPVTA